MATKRPPTPVTLAIALAPGSQPLYNGPGSVVPAHVYHVAFEIPGRVAAVNADVGDRVRAGSVLAALDQADYAAQARNAEARALEADAQALKATDGSRPQERDAADGAVAAAKAQLDRASTDQRLAERNAERFGPLYASGDIAAQQHDQTMAAARDAEAAVAAVRAQLAQAEAQRALVLEGTRAEDVAASIAGAQAAHASADFARVTLAKTRILAPADAYVQQRAVEPGSDAQAGTTAFVLIDARTPDVQIAVPESRLDGIAVGTGAIVQSAGRRYRGTVARIEPDADAATRTAQVRVRVPGLRARSGAVVDVSLGSAKVPAQATVPLGAIVADPSGGSSVLVYDPVNARAVRRAVHVISGDGERAQIVGIAPGTRVVRAGASLVRPGARVVVVPSP
ncbi:MAG TPA: efflux RND transporter periplasmic adaptor subunit [Candidatus Acidoferrum sp.]|nr:efflux RND transporter periplasmic adaptor subunit [Candidatus Acidoferrum sp.]